MGSAQRKFYADYELTGVVPEGGKNKQYWLCGVKLKSYTISNTKVRARCRNFKTVLFNELLQRFPEEKQQLWRSIGLLFNSKNWPKSSNPTDDEIDAIIDQTPVNCDENDIISNLG